MCTRCSLFWVRSREVGGGSHRHCETAEGTLFSLGVPPVWAMVFLLDLLALGVPDPEPWMDWADGLVLLLLMYLLVLSFYGVYYLVAAASFRAPAPVELFLAPPRPRGVHRYPLPSLGPTAVGRDGIAWLVSRAALLRSTHPTRDSAPARTRLHSMGLASVVAAACGTLGQRKPSPCSRVRLRHCRLRGTAPAALDSYRRRRRPLGPCSSGFRLPGCRPVWVGGIDEGGCDRKLVLLAGIVFHRGRRDLPFRVRSLPSVRVRGLSALRALIRLLVAAGERAEIVSMVWSLGQLPCCT